MFLQLKEPLRSIRRIGVKPWYIHRCQLNRVNQSLQHSRVLPHSSNVVFNRSHTTTAVLQPLTAVEIIPNQSIHVKDPSKLLKECQLDQKPLLLKDYEQHMNTDCWEKVIQIFHEAKSAGIKPSPSMYLSTIKAYGYMGDSSLVIQTFKEYKKRFRLRPTSYQRYIRAVLNCNDLPTAHKIYKDVKYNPKLTAKEASLCLSELIPTYIAQEKDTYLKLTLKTAEDLYYTTQIHQWDHNALTIITNGVWKCHAQLAKLEHTPISPISLENLISTYMDSLSSKHSLTQCNMLVQLAAKKHVLPTVRTCNLLLDAQSKGKDFAGMKSVIALMQKLNMDPNTKTVSILLRTFGASLPIEEAEKLYDSLEHDSNICNVFIKIFAANSGSGSQTQHVVSEMKRNKIGMDTGAFMDLAEGYVKRNELDEGFQWLQASKCKDLDSYAVLMEGLLNRGEWSKCVSYYDTLTSVFEREKVDLNHRVVKCMLAAQFSQNNMDACDTYLTYHLKFKFTPNTIIRVINSMLDVQTKGGKPLVPGHTIRKSLNLLESRLHVYLDAEGISRIIIRLGDRRECLEGYLLYKWIREHGHQAVRERCGHGRIYKALMFSATKNNNIQVLERAWVDMQYRKQFFGNKVKLEHDLSSYNILLNGYASYLPRPDLTRLKRTFKKMLNQKLDPNLVTYNILIKAFVSADNMTAAKQIYRKMVYGSNIQPDARTINTLLHGWIIRKDWGQVENFVQDLQKKSEGNLDIITFNLLVQSFLQLNSKSISYHKQDGSNGDKQSMSSDTIWSIFESSTGFSKSLVESPPASGLVNNSDDLLEKLYNLQAETESVPKNQNAFIKLFSNSTEANEITYKLFMKAFVNIGDYDSASKMYQWMKKRLYL